MVGTLKDAFSKRHKGLVGPKEMTVTVSSSACAQGNMDKGTRPDRRSSFPTTCRDPLKVQVEVETQGCVLFLYPGPSTASSNLNTRGTVNTTPSHRRGVRPGVYDVHTEGEGQAVLLQQPHGVIST